MGSRLAAIATAFDNVYSGWILWNLFLAFVPLLLSFWLFRPRALPRRWFQPLIGVVTAIGVIGLWTRVPNVLRTWGQTLGNALTGDISALLRLSWLAVVLLLVIGLWQWGLSPRDTRRPWLWWLGVVVFIAFLPNAPYVLTDIIHLIRGTRTGASPTWVIALVFVPIHITAIVLGFEAYVISLLNVAYYLKQQGAKAFILPMELTMHALSAIKTGNTAGPWAARRRVRRSAVAIGAHFVGFGVHLHVGLVGVELHVGLAEVAAVDHGRGGFGEANLSSESPVPRPL
jgi:uncharacterized membrane protein